MYPHTPRGQTTDRQSQPSPPKKVTPQHYDGQFFWRFHYMIPVVVAATALWWRKNILWRYLWHNTYSRYIVEYRHGNNSPSNLFNCHKPIRFVQRSWFHQWSWFVSLNMITFLICSLSLNSKGVLLIEIAITQLSTVSTTSKSFFSVSLNLHFIHFGWLTLQLPFLGINSYFVLTCY